MARGIEPLSDGTGCRVALPDGRGIGVREVGNRDGWPLLLFPGTPGSRLSPLPDGPVTRAADARVFVIERPGFGVSDPQPRRRILDWPADVECVANALGLDTFAIAGMSGAGPYLAACALALPARVRAVGMLGVIGPVDAPGVRRAMTVRRRLLYRALRFAPRVVPLLRALGAGGISRAMTDDVPACDRRILERIREPYAAMKREALRQGPEAFAWELALLAGPWGFALEDIRVPVHLWHGELDVSTPSVMGKYLAATIPNCHAEFVPVEGHFVAYALWAGILRALAP
jgi:pimeloyl-ACP methyl ester carboxylesterase